MAARTRGLKEKYVSVRMTPRQFAKLEQLAVIRDATVSEVLREMVDDARVVVHPSIVEVDSSPQDLIPA